MIPGLLRPLLTHPRVPWVAAAVGVLLTLPALWTGLAGDDWVHLGILDGVGVFAFDDPPVLTLFRFMPGGAGNAHLLDLGMMPWWANPDIRAAFLRPLSALTHVLDHRLVPGAWVAHHAHSLAWYGVLCGLAATFYRRVVGSGGLLVAGLAALLFAVEDAHTIPAGWLANRNALVSVSLGLCALLLHLAGRQAGRLGPQVAAPAVFLLALLGGESGLGALAYLGAWELFCARGPLTRKVAALAPWLVVVGAWRVAYNALGYGAEGGGLYIDPGREPLVFLGALATRGPTLVLAQWLQVPVDGYLVAPVAAQVGAAALGLLTLAGVGWWAAPTLRASAPARALGLGALVAVIPVCGAFPMDRLLLWPGLGALGLLAAVAGGDPAGWRRPLTGAMLVVHGPIAAAMLLARTAMMPALAAIFAAGAREAPTDPALSQQTLFFLNGSEIPVVYTPLIRQVGGLAPAPRRVALLASMRLDNAVTVEDEDTLVYTVVGGFLGHPSDTMFRNPGDRFVAGERIEMPDFVAEVREITPDGRPQTVAYHLREGLGSESYRFVAWRDGRLEEVDLPAAPGGLRLPPTLPLPARPLPGEGPAYIGMDWLLGE